MYIQLDGQVLYYEKAGEGTPVLLLHGNQETHEIFTELAAELEKKYTVYTLDTRGHGLSATPASYHYQDMAEDILNFIQALEIHRPILCGFSDGGIVALLVAIKNSDLLSGLIVCGANLSPKGLRGRVVRQIRRSWKKTQNPLDELMLTEPNIAESDLAKITVPALVLAGKKDIVKPAETKRIASGIANATQIVLPGEDHGSYVIHSDKLLPYFAEITSLIS